MQSINIANNKSKILKLPEFLVKNILLYCDIKSLTNLFLTNKNFNKEVFEISRLIAHHLDNNYHNINIPYNSKFEDDKINYLEILVKFNNSPCEVLLMGGLSNNSLNSKNVYKAKIGKKDGIHNEIIEIVEFIPMFHKRLQQSVIYQNGEIFSFGESSTIDINGLSRRSVEKFNKYTNEKNILCELPLCFHYGCIGFFDNKFYAINCTRSVFIFDLKNNFWIKHEEKTCEARHQASIIFFNEKLYLCGGGSNNKSVEVFDPKNEIWQIEGSMNRIRYDCSLFVFKDELYAVGGDVCIDDFFTIEKRGKFSKKWIIETRISRNSLGCAIFLVDNQIFVVGCRDKPNYYDIYNIDTKLWQSANINSKINLKLAHNFFGSRAVNITPYREKIWTNLL